MSDAVTTSYDGVDVTALASWLNLPAVHAFERTGSTQDVAHRLAAERAAAGTIVLAEEQRAGRGRGGRRWTSRAGAGIWISIIERPSDARAIEVLSLRLGLELARALDDFAPSPIRLKWPNDLYTRGGKLAGVLVEARWRDAVPEWVVIGIGLNIVAPHDEPKAAGLRSGVRRLDALERLVAAARRASAKSGALDSKELEEFARRDFALGRRCSSPATGVVRGITAGGALLVATGAEVREHRAGSLIIEDDQEDDQEDDPEDGG